MYKGRSSPAQRSCSPSIPRSKSKTAYFHAFYEALSFQPTLLTQRAGAMKFTTIITALFLAATSLAAPVSDPAAPVKRGNYRDCTLSCEYSNNCFEFQSGEAIWCVPSPLYFPWSSVNRRGANLHHYSFSECDSACSQNVCAYGC